jgi:hypothetical protein
VVRTGRTRRWWAIGNIGAPETGNLNQGMRHYNPSFITLPSLHCFLTCLRFLGYFSVSSTASCLLSSNTSSLQGKEDPWITERIPHHGPFLIYPYLLFRPGSLSTNLPPPHIPAWSANHGGLFTRSRSLINTMLLCFSTLNTSFRPLDLLSATSPSPLFPLCLPSFPKLFSIMQTCYRSSTTRRTPSLRR